MGVLLRLTLSIIWFTFLRLHIEGEKLFVDMFKLLDAAIHWEEMARGILAREADMSDFEDVIRFLSRFSFVVSGFGD